MDGLIVGLSGPVNDWLNGATVRVVGYVDGLVAGEGR